MRVGVTQNRFIGEGSFFRASSGIFLKAAWVLYSSEKGSTIAAMPVPCRLLRLPKPSYLSYLAGVIRGVARFISVYEGEYSRERLVQQLARTHPKTITQLAQKDTGSSANRHMRQILRIYNGASREMSLPLKN